MPDLWVTVSAIGGAAVALIVMTKFWQRRTASRFEVRRIARDLLPVAEAAAARQGGDQVLKLKETRSEWASLQEAGVRAGGIVARRAMEAVRLLEAWEEDYARTGQPGARPDAWAAAESHVRGAVEVLRELGR